VSLNERPAPRVAAVIVTHNRLEKLRQTLARTLALPFSRVVVVDNASTDGTAAYLAALADPRLVILSEPENAGGAGGFARGFAAAAATGAEWLVCYDDDAYPAPDALERFAALNLGKDVGGVAAAVYFPDGRICPMNRPGAPALSLRRIAAHLLKRNVSAAGMDYAIYQRREPVEIGFSSFVGLFIRCALVRGGLGLPWEGLFIYRDDSIYTLTLTQRGHKLLFAPSVRFVHDCRTPVAGPRVYAPLWKAYYVIRNDMPFFRRYAGRYFYFILPALLARWLLQSRHYQERGRFLRLAWLAVTDGLRENFSRPHEEIVARAARP
jgi:GT2 family glycosyltransferase